MSFAKQFAFHYIRPVYMNLSAGFGDGCSMVLLELVTPAFVANIAFYVVYSQRSVKRSGAPFGLPWSRSLTLWRR